MHRSFTKHGVLLLVVGGLSGCAAQSPGTSSLTPSSAYQPVPLGSIKPTLDPVVVPPPPAPADPYHSPRAVVPGVLDVGPGRLAMSVAPTPPASRTINVQPLPTAHHTVAPGETLFAIARERLGDGQRWREITAVNPGLNPADLAVGQRLRLPAGGH